MATTTSMLPLLNVSSGVKAAMAEGSEVRREPSGWVAELARALRDARDLTDSDESTPEASSDSDSDVEDRREERRRESRSPRIAVYGPGQLTQPPCPPQRPPADPSPAAGPSGRRRASLAGPAPAGGDEWGTGAGARRYVHRKSQIQAEGLGAAQLAARLEGLQAADPNPKKKRFSLAQNTIYHDPIHDAWHCYVLEGNVTTFRAESGGAAVRLDATAFSAGPRETYNEEVMDPGTVTAVLRFKRSALDKKEVESANHSRETLAFVRRVVDLPPFRSWGDDKIVKLMRHARLKRAACREVLKRHGDPAEIVIVARGAVRVSLPLVDAAGAASKVDVASLRAVDVLGLVEMLRDQFTMRCTVVATADVDYVVCPIRRFSALVDGDASLDMLQRLARRRATWEAFVLKQGVAACLWNDAEGMARYQIGRDDGGGGDGDDDAAPARPPPRARRQKRQRGAARRAPPRGGPRRCRRWTGGRAGPAASRRSPGRGGRAPATAGRPSTARRRRRSGPGRSATGPRRSAPPPLDPAAPLARAPEDGRAGGGRPRKAPDRGATPARGGPLRTPRRARPRPARRAPPPDGAAAAEPRTLPRVAAPPRKLRAATLRRLSVASDAADAALLGADAGPAAKRKEDELLPPIRASAKRHQRRSLSEPPS
ncbi:hypothetical protein SO694_00137043 [Aureococcus anophagefferens]|uniref:Cyclic nucleotide-binding domain-containing protein n=1 Tax=Aureococcus anophagefferens TaxID=44056 RepID=A0ABR1GGB6_AURAN